MCVFFTFSCPLAVPVAASSSFRLQVFLSFLRYPVALPRPKNDGAGELLEMERSSSLSWLISGLLDKVKLRSCWRNSCMQF